MIVISLAPMEKRIFKLARLSTNFFLSLIPQKPALCVYIDNCLFSCYIFLMSVTQTVEIPVSHRLTIDVPREVPAGPAVIVFRPAATPSGMTAQEAMDRGLGLGPGPRIDPMEAIKRCSGLAKRLGINLSSDEFLEMRRQDKELEDRLDRINQ
jgi:hypothetical protein